jgi:hypothetical protein
MNARTTASTPTNQVVRHQAVLAIRAACDAGAGEREHYQWNMDIVGLVLTPEAELLSAITTNFFSLYATSPRLCGDAMEE